MHIKKDCTPKQSRFLHPKLGGGAVSTNFNLTAAGSMRRLTDVCTYPMLPKQSKRAKGCTTQRVSFVGTSKSNRALPA